MYLIILLFSVISCVKLAVSFKHYALNRNQMLTTSSTSTRLFAFDAEIFQRIIETFEKYDPILQSLGGEKFVEEYPDIMDLAEKHEIYLETQELLVKMRIILKEERSAQRREKQLKNFIDLYLAKLELEEVIKQKLGLPFNTVVDTPPEILRLQQIDSDIAELEATLKDIEVKLPEGKSTREARFG